ncbi:30S ribosomal protein S8 [candidate division WOR-3 bacterium]|nr:30S ribosomal protein S8 [candidate division WOR-3 bacterium]
MSMSDPIADMLTRLRNALMVKKQSVSMPYSDLKFRIAKIAEAEGYLAKVEEVSEKGKKNIRIELKYTSNGKPVITTLERVSRPGLRVYKEYKKLPRVMENLGIAVVSTPLGLMTDAEARKKRVGGEILCNIW